MDNFFWFVAVPLVIVCFVLRERAFSLLMRRSGRREDGTWEKGRGPGDMTMVGKIAAGVSFVVLGGIVVMRFVDSEPGWLWFLALGIMVVCVTTVFVSERRRVRREGVDIGYGPGRLGPKG